MWRAFFHRCGSPRKSTSSVESRATLGAPTYAGEAGQVKRSVIHRYRFPAQPHEIAVGRLAEEPRDCAIRRTQAGGFCGTVVALDLARPLLLAARGRSQLRATSGDFGDGTNVTTTGNVVDHVYTTAGARTARVTVVSVEDDRGTSQTTVLVAPSQLAVTLAVDPVAADAGQPVTFTATVSPADAVIVRYEWSFGDAGENTANTTSPTTTFAYADADRGATRTVTVTAVAFDDTSVSTQGLVSINP